MKEIYNAAELEVVTFESADVIATSNPDEGPRDN